jgi:hypothetical protein
MVFALRKMIIGQIIAPLASKVKNGMMPCTDPLELHNISSYLRNFRRGYVGLTLWSWVILQKVPSVAQLFRNFPAFYCTQRFITMFTRAHCWSLLRARLTHFIPPHHISLRSVLIIDYHQCLGPPSGLFSSGFPTKTLYAVLFSLCVLHALPISFLIWSF